MYVFSVLLLSSPSDSRQNTQTTITTTSPFFLYTYFFSFFPSQCPWLTAIVMFVCTLLHLPTPCTKKPFTFVVFSWLLHHAGGIRYYYYYYIAHSAHELSCYTDLSSEYRKEMMQQYSVVLRQKPSPSEKLSLALAPIIQNIVQGVGGGKKCRRKNSVHSGSGKSNFFSRGSTVISQHAIPSTYCQDSFDSAGAQLLTKEANWLWPRSVPSAKAEKL